MANEKDEVDSDIELPRSAKWDELNDQRLELIHKKYKGGGLSDPEVIRLEKLQDIAEHRVNSSQRRLFRKLDEKNGDKPDGYTPIDPRDDHSPSAKWQQLNRERTVLSRKERWGGGLSEDEGERIKKLETIAADRASSSRNKFHKRVLGSADQQKTDEGQER